MMVREGCRQLDVLLSGRSEVGRSEICLLMVVMMVFDVCYQNAEKATVISFPETFVTVTYNLLIVVIITVTRSTSAVVRAFGDEGVPVAMEEEVPEEVTTFLAALALDGTFLFSDFDSYKTIVVM